MGNVAATRAGKVDSDISALRDAHASNRAEIIAVESRSSDKFSSISSSLQRIEDRQIRAIERNEGIKS